MENEERLIYITRNNNNTRVLDNKNIQTIRERKKNKKKKKPMTLWPKNSQFGCGLL
jgi:hypothetical protein